MNPDLTGSQPRRPWLLVSDIDDTLTGDDDALAVFGAALERNRDRLWFAVNSSRPAGSVAETLERVFPPGLKPDAVITGLGTEISVDGAPLRDWDARFDGWPAQEIFDILQGFGHRAHDAEYQTARKVSFAVPKQAQPEALAALAPFDCRIVASGVDDFDVIPALAGKGVAAIFLAESLGLPVEKLVVSGDSGNDLAMFRVSNSGIAVRNARPELIDALAPGSFYHARASHAGGVLEGLKHYGVLPPEVDERL